MKNSKVKYASVLKEENLCVVGNEEALKEQKEMFEELKYLNER